LIDSRGRCAADVRGAAVRCTRVMSINGKGGVDKLLPGYGKRRS
jgi:hypothetical protein